MTVPPMQYLFHNKGKNHRSEDDQSCMNFKMSMFYQLGKKMEKDISQQRSCGQTHQEYGNFFEKGDFPTKRQYPNQ